MWWAILVLLNRISRFSPTESKWRSWSRQSSYGLLVPWNWTDTRKVWTNWKATSWWLWTTSLERSELLKQQQTSYPTGLEILPPIFGSLSCNDRLDQHRQCPVRRTMKPANRARILSLEETRGVFGCRCGTICASSRLENIIPMALSPEDGICALSKDSTCEFCLLLSLRKRADYSDSILRNLSLRSDT